jgi:hypothetical protein
MIRIIDSDTQTTYNEQLERQYNALEKPDLHLVDYLSIYEIGMPADLINCGKKCGETGIAKRLLVDCEAKRMRLRQVRRPVQTN